MTRAVVSRREWVLVLLFALALVVVTSLPYLVAWQTQNADWQFGGFLFGAEDGYSYLAKMRLGVRGLWDFYLFYTPEPHAPAPLVYLGYIAPGHLVGLFYDANDPALPAALAVANQIMRIVADMALIVVLYRFIATFVRPVGVRMTALLLATLGGGLGWLLPLVGAGNAPEFYLPESFGFLLLFGIPHLALARAALFGGLLLFLHAFDGDHPTRNLMLAAACWWLVGLVVPFYVGIVYMVLGIWGLMLWAAQRRFPLRLARLAIGAGLLTVPLLLYYLWLFSTNPAMGTWTAQNQLPAAPPLDYLLAYAVIALPALYGLRVAWRRARHDPRFALLVGWGPAGVLLVYTPIAVQRRLSEGVLVPLALLAALGLWAWVRARALRPRRRRRSALRSFGAVALPLVVLASMSTVLLLLGSFGAAAVPRLPLFRPAAEVAAFDWLNRHAPTDAIVLAPVVHANALPVFANVRTYMGHGPETIDWPRKSEDVRRFFAGDMDTAERAALLSDYDIAYVLASPAEADPASWAVGLTQVYAADGYRVYETGASSAAR